MVEIRYEEIDCEKCPVLVFFRRGFTKFYAENCLPTHCALNAYKQLKNHALFEWMQELIALQRDGFEGVVNDILSACSWRILQAYRKFRTSINVFVAQKEEQRAKDRQKEQLEQMSSAR